MLYLIGLGLKPQQLTLEGLNAIKGCSEVLLENYTSQYSIGTKEELEQITEKKILELERKQVEEEFTGFLNKAKTENIAFLVIGNPLVATTHIQLLLDAKKNKTPVQVIPGISIADMVGKTGLDSYKFGRIATIVFQEHDYHPESFFDIIEQNNQNGFHSLCLLDIRTEQKKFMKIPEAVEILEKIAKKKGSILFNDCLLAGLSGMASAKEKIVIGTAKDLKKTRFDETPQSLIVCGKLNDKEKESFRILWGTKI